MNIIRIAWEILIILAVPVIEAEQKYGSLPKGATEEEKAAHQKLKIDDFNQNADEMIEYAVKNKIFPTWIAGMVKNLKGAIAPVLVRIANFNGLFGHDGNPPQADQ